MTTLTVLPHSSACVERIFSQVNCVKTKTTNALKSETVRDRLIAKQYLTRNNLNCITWQPTKTLTRELEDGTVRQRYQKRLQKEKETVTLFVDVDEEETHD